jgi:hypothetical protein
VEVEAEEVEEVVGVDLSVGVPKKYKEPESCGSAADFLLGVEMERDPLGREEVEVDILMAVETDLLSNHNDSTKCQSSSPATSTVNDDQVDLTVDDDSGSIDSTSSIFIAGHVDFAMESIAAVDNVKADDDDVIDVPDFETTTAPVDGDHFEATATAPPIAELNGCGGGSLMAVVT